MTTQLEALITQISKIPDSEFAEYRGGWPDQIGTALVDAVFSIRAKYDAKNEALGVLGRTRTLIKAHPEVADDLQALVDLGAGEIESFMTSAVSSGRRKSACVVEAAQNLLDLTPQVRTASDITEGVEDLDARVRDVRRAYRRVHGLGGVTAEYFTMLLGIPGVKPDRMILEFVNRSLRTAGLKRVDTARARALVEEAFEAIGRGDSLTHFDHAIWRTKGELVPTD
ncbi:hypothetical protein Bequi_11735 [Brachybacterium sp. JHP9]|uniref:Uncharacterized protein n=1 Tax=Brachybacterium equifaecis TaxID=2910770 RepID=A0ABT0R2B4_9MICO|nr:hypothetical protein [Brachybacterium equifaecis]MCL6424041.1 hypothetical protein [Brachybacterium equifaecis]